jgi:hypothetical protein
VDNKTQGLPSNNQIDSITKVSSIVEITFATHFIEMKIASWALFLTKTLFPVFINIAILQQIVIAARSMIFLYWLCQLFCLHQHSVTPFFRKNGGTVKKLITQWTDKLVHDDLLQK